MRATYSIGSYIIACVISNCCSAAVGIIGMMGIIGWIPYGLIKYALLPLYTTLATIYPITTSAIMKALVWANPAIVCVFVHHFLLFIL